jgi:hypothetical protein
MADNKTKATEASVDEFINAIENEKKRKDSQIIIDMMREAMGEKPVMWGGSIVGFGSYHYKYESGREGDSPKMGFSPRKQNLTLYVLPYDLEGTGYQALLDKLGKHTMGKVCLYIKKLADVDQSVLKELIQKTAERAKNPEQ